MLSNSKRQIDTQSMIWRQFSCLEFSLMLQSLDFWTKYPPPQLHWIFNTLKKVMKVMLFKDFSYYISIHYLRIFTQEFTYCFIILSYSWNEHLRMLFYYTYSCLKERDHCSCCRCRYLCNEPSRLRSIFLVQGNMDWKTDKGSRRKKFLHYWLGH